MGSKLRGSNGTICNLEFTINEISFKTKDSGLRYIIYKDKELTDMVTNTNYGIQL